MELLLKYFPHLTEEQKRQFGALGELYADWNAWPAPSRSAPARG